MQYVALLRGVNVGGKNPVKMADLRVWAEALGYGEPRTLLNSGNLVFASGRRNASRLAEELADAIGEHAGFRVAVVVVSAVALKRALDTNPFATEPDVKPNHLLLYFSQESARAEDAARLHAGYDGPERIAAGDGVVYVHYVKGVAGSKLDNNRLDRLLGTTGTMRNLNTATKLAALATGE